MKYCLLLLLSLSFLSGIGQQKTDIVKITVPKIRVSQRYSSTIHISVNVREGFHIQANQLDDEFLIPTTLSVKANSSIITGNPAFPPSKKFRMEGADDYWKVYDGSFDISIAFKTTEIIQTGEYNLPATLRYQACDSMSCLAPRTIEFLIPIEVARQEG